MTPTEHPAKTPSPRTGIFATLRALLPAKGTGAPSRLALAFALSLSALALTATPALAETPETPELKVEPVFATIATFNGVLSPKGLVPAEGSYKFLYKASPTECEGGSETTPGLALGGAPEALPPEQVKGLAPATEYTVCLQITNPSIETAKSVPLTFKTTAAAKPEPPEATEVSERKATTATLNGVVNPVKEGEPGKYRFLYRQSASVCTGGLETTEEPAPGSPQSVSAAITGLEPGKPYTFCVKAVNALGEATLSTPKTFTAALPPETPEKQPATEVTATSWNLHGVLNPNAAREFEPGTYQFLYKQSATECEGGQATPKEPAAGHLAEAVKAEVTGLLPTTTYTFCLRAENGAGEAAVGPPETFTTPIAPPTVTNESVSNLTATEVTLSAQIDPGGAPTTYQVEYGPGKRTAEQALPGSKTPVGVQQKLTGLTPATEYHVRFLAHNSAGVGEGALVALTTAASAGPSALTLPDNRAYELVSPLDNADVYVPTRGGGDRDINTFSRAFRSAADGNSIAYIAEPPSSGGIGAVGNGLGEQYLAARGPTGWTAGDIVPSGSDLAATYEAFTGDLAASVIRLSAGDPGLTPDALPNCMNLYSRTSEGVFHPLYTATDTPGECGRPEFAGASADGSHLLLQTEARLTPEAEQAQGSSEEHCQQHCNLYESVGGALRLVNVLNGKPDPNATFGSPAPAPFVNTSDYSNVISADGSRIFWTDMGSNHIYVREDGATTHPISAGEATYWTATPDGRYVFYTEEGKLWRFDLNKFAESTKPEPEALAEARQELAGSGVLGVIGTNQSGEDGAYLYYVSTGVLASNENGNKELPTEGQPNVYLLHGAQTIFVATLSPKDNELEGPETNGGMYGDWQGSLGQRMAAVAPDGRHLVLRSQRFLTGYDSEIVGVSGEPLPEVFAYAADTRRMSCASCNPVGSRPSEGVPQTGIPFGGYLPVSSHSTYMPRWMSDDGSRVFFDTTQSLVAQDENHQQDVYEWEREGTASCPVATSKYGGCVFLLSGGTISDASYLVDTSADGNNVFLTSRAQLVPQDRNENVKLYDARVEGGFSTTSLACTGTGCQGVPPAPPIFATPSSATFNGVGNFPPRPVLQGKTAAQIRAENLARALKSCRTKRDKRKRAACEAQAKRRYGPPHKVKKSSGSSRASKASHKRRGK